MEENSKKTISISLPAETYARLTALANGQQKSLKSLIETALLEYAEKPKVSSQEDKIKPIEDTEPADSWGYNSDVRGK